MNKSLKSLKFWRMRETDTQTKAEQFLKTSILEFTVTHKKNTIVTASSVLNCSRNLFHDFFSEIKTFIPRSSHFKNE